MTDLQSRWLFSANLITYGSHLRVRTIKKQGNLSQVLRIESARASLTFQRVMMLSPHHLRSRIAILDCRAAARREMKLHVEHRQHKGLNNRAENSHQPTRRRERIMKRFKSRRQAQSFLSTHDQVANLFHIPYSEHTTANARRALRERAFGMWSDISKGNLAA